MKVVVAGDAWHGFYVSADDGKEREFITFAETIDDAVRQSHETLPDGAIIIALQREVIPEEEREIEAPKLVEAVKKQYN